MDPDQFTETANGRVVRTPAGNPAFVPNPAPRRLDLTNEAIGLLDEASGRLGVLNGIGSRLPNPHLLIAPYLRQEAVLSSRIEGTRTTLGDVYAAEAEQLSLVSAADVQEVQNYVAAHEYGLARLETLPLSLRLIRELHVRLLRGVRGRAQQPGRFRTYQNFVGGTTERDATYVGPPPDELDRSLDDFERFLHDRSLRPLIQMAVAHYQFEAIYPFGDGNGRVGRLLMSLFLAERELLPLPLLYLSAYFERSRRSYYEGLLRVSTHGDWDAWLCYVLEGVCVQAGQAAELADRLLGLHADYRERLQAARASANVLAVVDSLFVNPFVTARRVRENLGVTDPTARSVIRVLEKEGVLVEITGRGWGRVYSANAIYAAIQGGPEQ